MSFRKILVGIFMAGIICCGIGAGVTFQEYSSFKYMGEKRIETEFEEYMESINYLQMIRWETL